MGSKMRIFGYLCLMMRHIEPKGADWLAGGNRHELAVERIYAAAAELILERGFQRISVDEVAERAGCSRATLYRYVGGKKAIQDGVISRAVEAVALEVSAAVEPLEGERRVVEAVLLRCVRSGRTLQSVQDSRLPGASEWTSTSCRRRCWVSRRSILRGWAPATKPHSGWSG